MFHQSSFRSIRFTLCGLFIALVGLMVFALALSPTDVQAKGNKVSICHLDNEGNYKLINISENAAHAHLGHGDVYPSTNGLDENCAVPPLSLGCLAANIAHYALPTDYPPIPLRLTPEVFFAGETVTFIVNTVPIGSIDIVLFISNAPNIRHLFPTPGTFSHTLSAAEVANGPIEVVMAHTGSRGPGFADVSVRCE